jgi:outer membrane biosynthesis protein TonB
MDQAAKLAFGRWKFKPAMREGKPVPVEILVGVPVDATENVSN